jgi:L-alanine-DL-glutamate epimerase-like enolase superfamily enzyme
MMIEQPLAWDDTYEQPTPIVADESVHSPHDALAVVRENAVVCINSQKNIVYSDLDAYTVLSVDPVIGGMQVKNGVVILPNAPGLGVDIDPAFFNKLHRV